MTICTVHLPPGDHSGTEPDQVALDRTVFVREGFSWGAFIFGPLWLIARGLWVTLAAWVLVMTVLSVLSAYLTTGAVFFIYLAIALLLGFEGNTLRRLKLNRRGYACVDVVAGAQEDVIERAFFARWLQPKGPASPLPPLRGSTLPLIDPHNDVLGHFPLPEGRR